MKTIVRHGTLLVAALALLVLTACGGRFRSYKEIEKHIDNPTAEVNGSNMLAAIKVNQEQGGGAIGESTGQVGAIPTYAWGTTAGGHTLYVPQRLQRFLPATLPTGIANISGAGCQNAGGIGSVDIEMELDMGVISSGEVTGTLKYKVDYDDICHFEIVIDMDNICDTITSECVDGAMGFLSEFDSMDFFNNDIEGKLVSSGRVSFTAPEHEAKLEWGLRVLYSSSNVSGEIDFVSFIEVDGDSESLVISAKWLQGSGTVTVRGKNGEFTCDFTNDGESGTCTGSGSDGSGTVTWSGA